MANSRQAGFSLIELMIVLTVAAVLAAVALPAYRDYSVRAKVGELVLAAGACRTAISLVFDSATGRTPVADGFGCERDEQASSRHVAGVSTSAEGAVTVTARAFGDADLDGAVLTLVPLGADDEPVAAPGDRIMRWRCGSAADGTTVPARYLPATCRG